VRWLESIGWCPACPSGACAPAGVSVATRHHHRQDGHHVRTSPPPHRNALPGVHSLCTAAGRRRAERRDDRGRGQQRTARPRARSASIDGKRFDITPADLSGVTSLERLRSGVFLGVLDNEAGAAEDVSLPAGRFNLYLTQVGGTWAAYAESGGKVYPAKRAIEKPDGPPGQQPTFHRGSGCWWLWLIFTGIEVCW
jgi:hypothetical protein